MNTFKTAVLVFNATSKQQVSLQELAPNMPAKRVSGLLEVLNNRTKSLATRTKMPLFQVDIKSNEDFGEQTYTAYQKLFDLGFHSVIGISNDCPTLEYEDILNAAQSLKSQQVVLGPAKDGGLYLFGLRRDQLSKDDFIKLNWQTDTLCSEVLEACSEKFVKTFPVKADMDTAADFLAASRLSLEFLTDFFKQLFSFVQRVVREQTIKTGCKIFIALPLRAPPRLVFVR